jgi:hypothetical protein
MPNSRPVWSADCPVSMPEPTGDEVIVAMYGFGMSQYRLVHDITSVEYEELRVVVGSPHDPSLREVPGDRGA